MKTKFLYASLLIYSVGVYAGEADSGADQKSKQEAEAKAKSEGDAQEKVNFKPVRNGEAASNSQICYLFFPHPKTIFPLAIKVQKWRPKTVPLYVSYEIGARGYLETQQSEGEYRTLNMYAQYTEAEAALSENGGTQLTEDGEKLADKIVTRLLEGTKSGELFIKERDMKELDAHIQALFKQ